MRLFYFKHITIDMSVGRGLWRLPSPASCVEQNAAGSDLRSPKCSCRDFKSSVSVRNAIFFFFPLAFRVI